MGTAFVAVLRGRCRTMETPMKRMHLYIKVEVELDEGETPDRIANEICRVIRKLYAVRAAELSSAVARE